MENASDTSQAPASIYDSRLTYQNYFIIHLSWTSKVTALSFLLTAGDCGAELVDASVAGARASNALSLPRLALVHVRVMASRAHDGQATLPGL